ncbi:MAG: styrene monooxygenase/indole monooxygenase family protein [Pseudomonas sp.]|jgi:hypothetical protein|nr:styrene monooxygenase/indole monooxygenase family protein [Pseudomonas sp.]
MKTITIIGAGQAGLQLGIGLLKNGYKVNIVSNRTAKEISIGRVPSSQSMYDMALSYERELGIAFWDDECPPADGLYVRAGHNANEFMIDWKVNWKSLGKGPVQAVDQRMKMPRWMDEFQRLGGTLIIRDADIDDLEFFAASSDLVIIASGKGEIGKLFERDEERSQLDKPQRVISLTYVHGMLPHEDYSAVTINIKPGVGEYINFPGLTHTGACDIINLEGIPGGPMDCWDAVKSPQEHLKLAIDLIHEFFPWEAYRCKNLSLTDDLGILAGRVTPTVRKPIGVLPSGRTVLGMADVLVLNDPMTGQGSNNASKCANVYMNAIINHQGKTFDDDWKQETFERFWDYAEWAAKLVNTHILPPTNPLLNIFTACNNNPELAAEVANGFNDPRTLNPWYYDAEKAEEFIESLSPEMVY